MVDKFDSYVTVPNYGRIGVSLGCGSGVVTILLCRTHKALASHPRWWVPD